MTQPINPKDKSFDMPARVKVWRENPGLAAEEILNVELAPYQRFDLKMRWKHDLHFSVFGRGMGKTWLDGVDACLSALLWPGNRVGLIGPSFRQSKFVFEEVDKLWQQSPILQEATTREPSMSPDSCTVQFKAANGRNPSIIMALPIGADGAKIRGARFYKTIADEAVQIDNNVLKRVVRGFMATHADPMANVRLVRKLREEGKTAEEALESVSSNKMVMTSTMFFQWNHFYQRIAELINQINDEHGKAVRKGGDCSRFVFAGAGLNGGQLPFRAMSNGKSGYTAFPWQDAPLGFLDLNSIEQARHEMSDYEFRMEYECFAGGTEIITPEGLKPIEEIEVGDLVLTHRGRFRRVTETMSRLYSGPVLDIDAFGYNRTVTVTPEHPFWAGNEQWEDVKDMTDPFRLARLKELSGLNQIDLADYCDDYLISVVDGVEYLYPRPSQSQQEGGTRGADTKFKSCIPRYLTLDEDLGKIIGYYASEGSMGRRDALGRPMSALFSLDGHHDRSLRCFVVELSDSLERTFGRRPRHYYNTDASCCNVTYNSRLVASMIKAICPGLASNKAVRHEVLFSNPSFLRGFLIGYLHGDGCINSKPKCSAGSTSRNLLAQIRLALSYFGYASSLRDAKQARMSVIRGRVCQCQPFYDLSMLGDDARRFAAWMNGTQLPAAKQDWQLKNVMSEDDAAAHRVRRINTQVSKLVVYNLEVEEDHSYSTPIATVHNCFAPADSEGFFRRSLLDASRRHAEFGPVLEPRPGCIYTMGIDPARTSDNFAIAIFEIDPPLGEIRLVRVFSYNKKNFPMMAREVRRIKKHYGIEYFKMDAGGGGTTIRDALADKATCPPGEKLILEREFDEHKLLIGERHLGKLVQFSNYAWVHDANHNLLAALQRGDLKIASQIPVANHVPLWTQDLEDADKEIDKTIAEMSNVVVSSAGQRLRWDTPTKEQRKDRYSAVLIGFDAASELLDQHARPQELIMGSWL